MENQQKIQIASEQEINEILTKYENDKIMSNNTEKILTTIIKNQITNNTIILNMRDRIQKINKEPSIIYGFLYQTIIESGNDKMIKELSHSLPNGVLELKKSMQLDYQPLQNLLINKEFQQADKLTQEFLCKIVEKKKNRQKNWLYFTEIQFIPKDDLKVIDLLWRIYSKGKFGFSIQKKIWLMNNRKWDKLWKKIKWVDINNGNMKRYPQEFLWTLEAPEGHLPLSNQLRGTQSLTYLFKTIEW